MRRFAALLLALLTIAALVASAASAAPGDRRIAYTGSPEDVCLLDSDALSRFCFETDPLEPNASLAWSPDGKMVAVRQEVLRESPEGLETIGGQIRLFDASGVQPSRVISGIHIAAGTSVWSADSKRVAFEIDGGIVIANATGVVSRTLKVDRHSAFVDSLAWSPDGSTFATTRIDGDVSALAIIDAATGTVTDSVTFPGEFKNVLHNLRWSPDGAWLLFVMMDLRGLESELWRVDADGSGLRQLHGGNSLGGALLDAAISPDGATIAFEAATGGLRDVLLMDTDGANIRPLVSTAGNKFRPRFSPGGTEILYRDDSGLAIVSLAAGSTPRQLPNTLSASSHEWAPAPGMLPAGAVTPPATPTPLPTAPAILDEIPRYYPVPIGPPFAEATVIGGCPLPGGSVEITATSARDRGQRVFQISTDPGSYMYLRADGSCVTLHASLPIPEYVPEGPLGQPGTPAFINGIIGPNAGSGMAADSAAGALVAAMLACGVISLAGAMMLRRPKR